MYVSVCRLEYGETKQMELDTSNRDTVNMFLYDLRGRSNNGGSWVVVGHGSTCTDPWPCDPSKKVTHLTHCLLSFV